MDNNELLNNDVAGISQLAKISPASLKLITQTMPALDFIKAMQATGAFADAVKFFGARF